MVGDDDPWRDAGQQPVKSRAALEEAFSGVGNGKTKEESGNGERGSELGKKIKFKPKTQKL